MIKSLIHLTLLCLVFLSCNSREESYQDGVADAKEAIRKEDELIRKDYVESYQAALHNEGDSGHRKMYVSLDSAITTGVHYMDSIYGEMSFQADHAPTNFEYVKILFINKRVGDTLFATLTRINDLAKAIALETGHAQAVDSLKLTVLDKPTASAWKEVFSAGPAIAMVFVHNLTCEVFRVGKASFPIN
jgi:hypothetical protein